VWVGQKQSRTQAPEPRDRHPGHHDDGQTPKKTTAAAAAARNERHRATDGHCPNRAVDCSRFPSLGEHRFGSSEPVSELLDSPSLVPFRSHSVAYNRCDPDAPHHG
jgi:hypothetical protein